MGKAQKTHSVIETSTPTLIIASCECGESVEVPNKGMGRAIVGAFHSRHQPPISSMADTI